MSPTLTPTKDAFKAVLADLIWPVAVAWQKLLDATTEESEPNF